MERRRFLTSSLAASALALAKESKGQAPTSASKPREYYELREYRLQSGPQTALTERYIADALMPALNRLGISRVGAFNLTYGPETPVLYLLIPSTIARDARHRSSPLGRKRRFPQGRGAFLECPREGTRFHSSRQHAPDCLRRLAPTHASRGNGSEGQAHLPTSHLRRPKRSGSRSEGRDDAERRVREFSKVGYFASVLWGRPHRRPLAPPDLHAELFRFGRDGSQVGSFSSRSRLESAFDLAEILLRGDHQQHLEFGSYPNILFPDLELF